MDLVKKEISESVKEPAATPSQSVTVKNGQREISEMQKFNWLHKRNVRRAQSKGIRI
jgi:hypothetical protein